MDSPTETKPWSMGVFEEEEEQRGNDFHVYMLEFGLVSNLVKMLRSLLFQ